MIAADDSLRFWNRIAKRYASDPIKDMAGYERTLAETRRWLAGRSSAIEIGCGTGMTALRLSAHVARLTATDVAPAMIDLARQRSAQDDRTAPEFMVAPAERLPFADGVFDAALAFNLLHLTSDRAAVLAEARRVLAPEGLLISKTPCLSEMNPLIRIAVPAMRLVGKAPDVRFFDAAELERDIAAAGFEILERARHGSARRDPRIFIVARRA